MLGWALNLGFAGAEVEQPATSTGGAGGISPMIIRRLTQKQRDKRKKKEAQEVNDHDSDVRAAIEKLYGSD